MKTATVDGNLLSCTQEHNHSPELADCETKTVLSSICKEIAATTRTRIYYLHPISQTAMKLHRVECVDCRA
jgi:hypothetical protein